MKERKLHLLLAVVYLLLPFLIFIEVINFDYKFYFLTIGALFVYVILLLYGFTNENMGFTSKNIKKSITNILPLSVTLFIISLIFSYLGFSQVTPNEGVSFYIFYVFISCPAQEFLYRGSLNAFLSKYNLSYKSKIIITSLLYSYVHIIYRDIFTLIITFIIGLIWYKSYYKTKNIGGVTVSHIILGIVTIMTGLVD